MSATPINPQVWWENAALMDELITLGKKLYDHSKNRHVIGIGQSPYYVMFAANCIAATQGGTFSHSHIPMSGATRAADRLHTSEAPIRAYYIIKPSYQLSRLTKVIGDICQQKIEAKQQPLIFDSMRFGKTSAVMFAILSMYDEEHDTRIAPRTRLLCFRSNKCFQGTTIRIERGSGAVFRLTRKKISAITIGNKLYTHLDIYPSDDERVIPESEFSDWGLKKENLPDNPTNLAIRRAIKAAVDKRYGRQ